MRQEEDEKFEKFVTYLRNQVKKYKFSDKNKQI